MRALLDGFLDLLYPPRCCVCRRWESPPFCETCLKSIEYIQQPFCPRCGEPGSNEICRACAEGGRGFERARAIATYTSSLGIAVRALKFRGALGLVRPLSAIIARFLDTSIGAEVSRVDMVMPVPIHRSRQRTLGFNHAQLLAEPVTTKLQVPLSETLLLRRKRTRPQRNLSFEERFQNVADAFEVTDPSNVAGRVVLVVDDIMTTGATLSACAATLREAGARSVFALAVVRQV